MAKINVSEMVVRDETGCVDIEATVASFRGELYTWMQEVEYTTALISQAVSSVFDAHKGACINMPALTSMALHILGATPTNYADLSEKVGAYVRTSKSLFAVSKGKGGGVRRIADMSAEDQKKLADRRAAEAAEAE